MYSQIKGTSTKTISQLFLEHAKKKRKTGEPPLKYTIFMCFFLSPFMRFLKNKMTSFIIILKVSGEQDSWRKAALTERNTLKVFYGNWPHTSFFS